MTGQRLGLDLVHEWMLSCLAATASGKMINTGAGLYKIALPTVFDM